MNLLLYSIFHVGDATNNVSWQSYREIATLPDVAWAVPLSLGDSHRGFRVMGTTSGFFDHYHYGHDQALRWKAGQPFGDLYDTVIGSRVAAKLHYRLGQRIVIAHGFGGMRQMMHADKPFRVVGILQPTGTPVDATVMVSLRAIEAIHVDWHSGIRLPGKTITADQARSMDLTPKAIRAFMLGLESRLSAFAMQRAINDYPDEALLAILPGVTLQQLWSLVGTAEKALQAISAMVVLVGLFGMLTALLTMLSERRREMAILRAVGASLWTIFAMLMLEAGLLAIAGAALGVALMYAVLASARGLIVEKLGISISLAAPSPLEWLLLAVVVGLALLAGCIPAWIAYRHSLTDGLQMRL